MEQPKNKYHTSKIYTLRSHQCETYYIGSTTQPLYKRLYEHRNNKKHYDIGKHHYITSFDIIKYDDNYIELLEEYKCDNKQQLERREGELIREHKEKCVNNKIAGRTKKEYAEENKEKTQTYMKQYQKNNKEDITEYKNEWYANKKETLLEHIQCVCGSSYTKVHKLRHERSKKHKQFVETNN
jgi:hypothetical protein